MWPLRCVLATAYSRAQTRYGELDGVLVSGRDTPSRLLEFHFAARIGMSHFSSSPTRWRSSRALHSVQLAEIKTRGKDILGILPAVNRSLNK